MSRAARAALWIAAGAVAVGCRGEPPPAVRGTAGSAAAGSAESAGEAAAGSAGSAGAATEPVAESALVGAGSAAGGDGAEGGDSPCTELPFERSTPVPEASGAAWLPIDGAPALVVISDSGHDGAYAILDPETGATREQGKLPLGGPGDDLEGVAVRGGKLYAISSPGWMRVYERKGKGFALVEGPYALGPIDLDSGTGLLGDKPPKGSGMVCEAKRLNCGRNYEGLCLAPKPGPGRCIGFAAAKADGHLYCIVESGGKLHVEYAQSIKVGRPGVVSDCAFAADGRLYAGTNTFDGGNVYRVTGWEDPARAQVARLGPALVGFPEALAVRGDVFYVLSDTGGAPSLMKRLRCPGTW